MNKSNRLTPARVRKAYLETGLLPYFGNWFSELTLSNIDKPCACAAAAVCMAENKKTSTSEEEVFTRSAVAKALGLTFDYVAGFVAGFDWNEIPTKLKNQRENVLGYNDGMACRVEAEGIMKWRFRMEESAQ